MIGDKYTAIWLSYSSLTDYMHCARAYYLKHMYRSPTTNRKFKIVSPPLSLGQSVHEVLEALSVLPVAHRFNESLVVKFDEVWKKVSGKKGGFPNLDIEAEYKRRGEEMLLRIMKNPGPLARPAVKIKMDLPYYWFSPEDNIILCGKIDWLEYIPENDKVHIIDFKTSKKDESTDSLQLPIYCLLVSNCQKREVEKISYWYLDREDGIKEATVPDMKACTTRIFELAKEIKTARKLGIFKCNTPDGCSYCRPLEAVLDGLAEHVGIDDRNCDMYVLPDLDSQAESIIL